MSDIADQERTTKVDWRSDRDSAKHFSEPQLDRWEHYRGPLARVPEEEVRALFRECLQYFELRGIWGVPLPPVGLPGVSKGRTREDRADSLISLGYRYFIATARNEPRAMNNLWDEAEDFFAREVRIERRRAEALAPEATGHFDGRRYSPRDEAEQVVYFIGAETGPVKIGIAAQPEYRLASLQTAHHTKLGLLAVCPGGREQEKDYHARFAAHRQHGEWFERHPDILAEIERLNASQSA